MADNSRDGFNHKAVLIFTITQLVCGCTSAVLGVCQLVIPYLYGSFGVGIWTGVMFVVTSILGFTSWKFKNNCNIIALMVLCIISSVVAFGGFVLEVITCVTITSDEVRSYTPVIAVPVALHSLLDVVIFVEFVVSIVCSVFCCRAVCTCQYSPDQVLVNAQVQPDQHTRLGGQTMDYVQAPVAPPAYSVCQNPALPADGGRGAENIRNSAKDEKRSQKDCGFGYVELNNE